MSSCSGGGRDAFKMNQSINFSQQSEGYCYKYFRLDQRISIVWSLNIFHVSSYYFSCDGILIFHCEDAQIFFPLSQHMLQTKQKLGLWSRDSDLKWRLILFWDRSHILQKKNWRKRLFRYFWTENSNPIPSYFF